jgi:uncharacterized protein
MTVSPQKIGPLRLLGRGVLSLLLLGTAAIVVSGIATKLPGEDVTLAGLKRNTSVYVKMPDGVRLAADIWLPEGYKNGDKLPVILSSTRYWRANDVTFLGRAAIGLGIMPKPEAPEYAKLFNPNGYIYIAYDARGSGASFGFRRSEWAPEEVGDMYHVVDWITKQPWSNAKVGGIGGSYDGNTAELLAASGHPAVKAVAPLFDDFDPSTFAPGGVRVNGFQDAWFAGNVAMDSNSICALLKVENEPCFPASLFTAGVKPVDGPDGKAELAKAVAEHAKNIDMRQAALDTPFIDDKNKMGLTIEDVSPYSFRKKIEAAQVPMLIWTGWFDGSTTQGAIARYNTFNTPQTLIIGALSHGGADDTDPFSRASAPPASNMEGQQAGYVGFFDCHMKVPQPKEWDCSLGKTMLYYDMGSKKEFETKTWPIAGTKLQRMYLSSNKALSEISPAPATESYKVNFTATTGTENRWATQAGGSDVIYNNRAAQAAKMLTYTGEALSAPVRITGAPIITLNVKSTHNDGAFHVYLESVGPDGTVRYLSEGVLRGSNRKISSEPAPYWQAGPYHSRKRKDYLPMIPGEMTTLSFAMFPTSVTIPVGHKIRISIAGADKDFYERVPEKGNPEWQISLGGTQSSFVDLPIVTE